MERDRQIFRIAKRAVAHIDSESEKNEFFDFEELSLDTGFRTKDCVAVKLTGMISILCELSSKTTIKLNSVVTIHGGVGLLAT